MEGDLLPCQTGTFRNLYGICDGCENICSIREQWSASQVSNCTEYCQNTWTTTFRTPAAFTTLNNGTESQKNVDGVFAVGFWVLYAVVVAVILVIANYCCKGRICGYYQFHKLPYKKRLKSKQKPLLIRVEPNAPAIPPPGAGSLSAATDVIAGANVDARGSNQEPSDHLYGGDGDIRAMSQQTESELDGGTSGSGVSENSEYSDHAAGEGQAEAAPISVGPDITNSQTCKSQTNAESDTDNNATNLIPESETRTDYSLNP